MKQTLKYIYDKLLDLIKIAEAKYSITLALASGVIVLGSSFIGEQDVYIKILASGTVVFALISIIYGFVALFARNIKPKKPKRNPHNSNLLFYKTIIQYDEKTYIQNIKEKYNFPPQYKPDGFDLDLAKSVIAQARVANIKFVYFNLSLVFLLLSIFLAVLMVIVLGGL